MSIDTLVNLIQFGVLMFVAFQFGRVYELNQQIKTTQDKQDDQEPFYGSRR